MAGYTKLFSRILDSTVWREDDKTRLLWITLLALADQDGNIFCTIPGLADRARVTVPECEAGLVRFQQPDKYSWSREDEGRKLRVIDGGWFLVNHAKYRALMCYEEQKEKTRLRVEKWREKRKNSVTVGNAGVTQSNAGNDKHIQKQKQESKPAAEPPISPFPIEPQMAATHVMMETALVGNKFRDLIQQSLSSRVKQGFDLKDSAEKMIKAVGLFRAAEIRYRPNLENFIGRGMCWEDQSKWGGKKKEIKMVDVVAQEEREILEAGGELRPRSNANNRLLL